MARDNSDRVIVDELLNLALNLPDLVHRDQIALGTVAQASADLVLGFAPLFLGH